MTTGPAHAVKPADLLRALRWRYATKKFNTSKKIPDDIWGALEEALVLTPSSYGLQPWKFIVVADPAVRAKLRAVSWNQSQITDASHLVVFAARKDLNLEDVERFVQRTAEVRKVPTESLNNYKNFMINHVKGAEKGFDMNGWAAHQVYIALGNFMTSAALLGIDTCPMEGLEPAKYDAILGLEKQGFWTVCAGVAGYRSDDDKYADVPKVRFETRDVLSRIE